MPPYPGFFGPTHQPQAFMASTERMVNWQLERNDAPNASTPVCMVPTPGFTEIAEVSQAPIRGMFTVPDIAERVFFVAGYALYELTYDTVTGDFSTTLRGTVSADRNPVTFAWNGPNGGHMFLTSGDIGYGYVLATNTQSTVLGSGATSCGFLGNRFLVLDATTSTLQASDLLSLTFDPTMIAERSLAPDPWIAMSVVNSDIWLGGSRTMEVWQDTGAFPFPFEPIPGAFLEQGVAAPFSMTRGVSPMTWIGSNLDGARVVWQANGYQPQRISTHGIEQQLARMTTVSDAFTFTYQDRGHLFSVLTFPEANRTFHYDVAMGPAGWGERGFWDVQTAQFDALRVGCHCYAFGKHLVGDTMTGQIYEMSADVYTDVDGAGVRRLRRPPRLSVENKRVNYHRVELIADVGVGLITGQGSDPQIMLRTSGDAGKTWGQEQWRSAGAIGAYGTRIFWGPCGQQRQRVDEFTVTDPVPFRIVEATVEFTVGRN